MSNEKSKTHTHICILCNLCSNLLIILGFRIKVKLFLKRYSPLPRQLFKIRLLFALIFVRFVQI